MIPGLGRSPGEGKGHPLQYSGLENSMDYTVHAASKSQTELSDFHFHFHPELAQTPHLRALSHRTSPISDISHKSWATHNFDQLNSILIVPRHRPRQLPRFNKLLWNSQNSGKCISYICKLGATRWKT